MVANMYQFNLARNFLVGGGVQIRAVGFADPRVLMLEARELTKSYASVPAVKDLTFSLSPGQVLGCLGPNGSGKSTTVKMLTGLLEPTRGKVLFNGEDIQEDLVSFRKCLGYVPEEPNL